MNSTTHSIEEISPATREKYIVELLGCLPDHWSLMRVTGIDGLTWQVYDHNNKLVSGDNDLETALNLAIT